MGSDGFIPGVPAFNSTVSLMISSHPTQTPNHFFQVLLIHPYPGMTPVFQGQSKG